MLLLIDRDGAEPVYRQIAGQIRERIASGELASGSRLPPVRGIASDLGVNLNTVARAYRHLEADGFIRIRERSGAEVLSPGSEPTRRSRDELRGELRRLIERMRQAGVEPDELRAWTVGEIDRLANREEER